MKPDPIVAEVRKVREQIARDADFDMHKLFEMQKRAYEEWPGRKLTYEQRQKELASQAKVAEGKATYGEDGESQDES